MAYLQAKMVSWKCEYHTQLLSKIKETSAQNGQFIMISVGTENSTLLLAVGIVSGRRLIINDHSDQYSADKLAHLKVIW